MSNDNAISQILLIALIGMIVILFILIIVYVALKVKTNVESKNKAKKDNTKSSTDKKDGSKNVGGHQYSKQSIYNFMEFDKVEDNMIVQKDGKRYIMVVECQGVNYDLMSQMEKISVEEGFQQFLNTLRHPIQIYIQTRTINLEEIISEYRNRIKDIENKYNQMDYEYSRMVEAGVYGKEQLDKQYFELTKQRNMYEYSIDLVNNTEKMSLNKSVLSKKYYIVIPYFSEESSGEKYTEDEIASMAFSELYTKSQAVIRTLSSCSVTGKILDSRGLIELLYVAYNRDDSELFGVDKALQSGYDDLYSTAEDVFEKKIRILDEKIENEAVNLANEKIEKAKSKLEQMAEEKEESMDDLIGQMAEIILQQNETAIGEDVVEEAINEIEKDLKEKEEKENEKKQKTIRGRKTSTRIS